METDDNRSLFHGGVPGLNPGDRLIPASKLAPWSRFIYDRGAKYSPDHVYLTTDLDSARRYATNYLAPNGMRPPGDVYEVSTRGKLLLDPDYPQIGRTKGAFLMTSSAVVERVVARGVQLTEDEKWRSDMRHAHWALDDGPVYDDEGKLQMSKPMAAHGVPQEWLDIIRPWYDGQKLRQDGRLVAESADELEEAFFDAVPQLDTTHPVQQRRRLFRLLPSKLVCEDCGESFGDDQRRAAIHQLGETEVQAVSALEGQGPLYPTFLVEAARRRHPERWTWLTLH